MKKVSFNQLLEDLRWQEENNGRREAFKLSAGVGLTVLSLAPQIKADRTEMAPRYEPLPAEQLTEPSLSLADLPSEIAKAATVRDLRRIRRRFARLCHPDRCSDSSGDMAAANRLIDDAIAALRGRDPGFPSAGERKP